jgi:hypothetical protein
MGRMIFGDGCRQSRLGATSRPASAKGQAV